MVEPEVAFNELTENMDLAEEFMKFLIGYALENYGDDIEFLHNRELEEEKVLPKEQRNDSPLIERLKFVTENDFVRISYTDAVHELRNSKPHKKGKFEYDVSWGVDLQSEHERWLVEKKFKTPVIITDYPKDIKAFYMKQNEDGKTVAAMDVLFPGIGEIIGGSQREEDLEKLKTRMAEMNVPEEELWWYLDTRKFGTAPHSGFGLGFERLMLFITGMKNIRDVIPFPRTPQNAEF
jgi:asparaginyl-tRNA synthetase